jgi:hypothetical protein
MEEEGKKALMDGLFLCASKHTLSLSLALSLSPFIATMSKIIAHPVLPMPTVAPNKVQVLTVDPSRVAPSSSLVMTAEPSRIAPSSSLEAPPIVIAAPAPIIVQAPISLPPKKKSTFDGKRKNAAGFKWATPKDKIQVDASLLALLQDKVHPARLVKKDIKFGAIQYIEVWNAATSAYMRTLPFEFLWRTLAWNLYNERYGSWKASFDITTAEKAAIDTLIDWLAGEMAKDVEGYLGSAFAFVTQSHALRNDLVRGNMR